MDLIDDTHPNFIIICKKCGSKEVYIDNDLGFSAASGAWGSVDLVCNNCENTCVIVRS